LAKLLGKKSIITGVFNFRHPPYQKAHDYFARPLWQKILIKRPLVWADLNIFVSKAEYVECAEYFQLPNAEYAPCCVGADYEQATTATRMTGMLNICWSGRGNLLRKGVFDILDAAKILVERGIMPQITLAGKAGDGYSELAEGVRQRGLDKHVRLAGEVSKAEKLRLLAENSIYLQPSKYEGFGLATAEAMASGASVITCDVGEVRQVVGDAAIYVTPGNTVELADAMQNAITDGALRSRLEYAARERITRLFSFEAKVTNLRRALDRVNIA
jgi:glycosyltransferase involved in cell wall biosynthesis